jgi:hypothetical protein
MVLPIVTWPSPPITTLFPRRTEQIVVPWYWGALYGAMVSSPCFMGMQKWG